MRKATNLTDSPIPSAAHLDRSRALRVSGEFGYGLRVPLLTAFTVYGRSTIRGLHRSSFFPGIFFGQVMSKGGAGRQGCGGGSLDRPNRWQSCWSKGEVAGTDWHSSLQSPSTADRHLDDDSLAHFFFGQKGIPGFHSCQDWWCPGSFRGFRIRHLVDASAKGPRPTRFPFLRSLKRLKSWDARNEDATTLEFERNHRSNFRRGSEEVEGQQGRLLLRTENFVVPVRRPLGHRGQSQSPLLRFERMKRGHRNVIVLQAGDVGEDDDALILRL